MIVLYVIGQAIENQIDESKARFLQSENITQTVYDTRVKNFGSYDDYRIAESKGMNAQQFAQFKSQKAACAHDWSKCSDNEQLVNDWSGWSKVQVACEHAAKGQAKYGDPEWPWLSFSTFYPGNDYISSGGAVAIERNAKFKNQFNASVMAQVVCSYDLKSDRVENVVMVDR